MMRVLLTHLILVCVVGRTPCAEVEAAPRFVGYMELGQTAMFRMAGSQDRWLRLGQVLDGFVLRTYADGALTIERGGSVLRLRLADSKVSDEEARRQDALAFALGEIKRNFQDNDDPLPLGITLA